MSVIILDVIMEQASGSQTTQLCSSLNNTYFSQNAQANLPYSFDWGPSGDTSDPLKIIVGTAEFLVDYDAGNQRVRATGVCGTTDWNAFSVSSQTLQYTDGSLLFTVLFRLEGGTDIHITIVAGSNTSIKAQS